MLRVVTESQTYSIKRPRPKAGFFAFLDGDLKMEAKKMLVSLNVDTSELPFQLAALSELLEPVTLGHIIDESLSTLSGSIRCLLDDIIFNDFSTTDGAANPTKFVSKSKSVGCLISSLPQSGQAIAKVILSVIEFPYC